ncbi:MAG: DUF3187 family protein [Fimbriimonadales bacterium]|nr:DUF3187 family protein [Fimbriimonadales bacterium]
MKGFALAGLLLLAPAQAASQELVPTRNHRGVSLAFYRWTPLGVGPSPGESRWSVGWTEANEFREAGDHLEDCETTRLALEFRRGLEGGWQFAAEIPLLARHGGFLDGVIDWWHAAVLGWSDPARDAAPLGRAVVRGPALGSFASAEGVGDASVRAARELGRWRLGAALKLPTGDAAGLLGSGGFDLCVAAEAGWELSRTWSLEAYAAWVAQGSPTRLRRARDGALQAGFGLVWKPNSRDRWIAQWQHEDSALRTGVAPLDAPHRLVTFGYRRLLGGGRSVEAFFTEDRDLFNGAWPEGANTGPDFAIGLRYAAPLGR